MELTIKNNQVVAHAKNQEESLALIRLAHGGEKIQRARKAQTVKKCDICGGGFKGLAMHKTMAHGKLPVNQG